VTLADGSRISVPYVGPIVTKFSVVDVNPESPNIASGIVKRAALLSWYENRAA
jgi:hypothetical protein